MDSEVSNGSGLEAKHITNLLVFGFLRRNDCDYHQELEVLGQELPVPVYPEADREDELQTDGSRASRSFCHGRIEPAAEETFLKSGMLQVLRVLVGGMQDGII